MAGSKKHANINKKCNRHSEIVSCAPSTKQYTSLKAWNKHSTLFMVIFVVTCMRSPLHFFFKHTTQHHSIDWKRLIYTFTAANTLAQLFIPFWCSNLIRGYALHFRLNTYIQVSFRLLTLPGTKYCSGISLKNQMSVY